MKLGLFGILMLCLEWWAFEVTIFLAGILGTTELGAQGVIFNVDALFVSVRIFHVTSINKPTYNDKSLKAQVLCPHTALDTHLLFLFLYTWFTQQNQLMLWVKCLLFPLWLNSLG